MLCLKKSQSWYYPWHPKSILERVDATRISVRLFSTSVWVDVQLQFFLCSGYDHARVMWNGNPLVIAACISVHNWWFFRAVVIWAVRSGRAWFVPLLVFLFGIWVHCVLFLLTRFNSVTLVLQTGFNLCWCRRKDSFDWGQAKRQRDEGDTGRESKILCTKKAGRECGMPSTVSELEAVSIPRKWMNKERHERLHGMSWKEHRRELTVSELMCWTMLPLGRSWTQKRWTSSKGSWLSHQHKKIDQADHTWCV